MRYLSKILIVMMVLVSAVYADITFLKIYEVDDDWAEPFELIEIAGGGYASVSNAMNSAFLRTDEYGEVIVQNNSLGYYCLCENQDAELVISYFDFIRSDNLVHFVWADLMGNILQTRFYEELNYHHGATTNCLIQTSDNGYVICGNMCIPDDGFVMKLDNLENYQWHIELPDAHLYSIIEDSESCFITGGSSSSMDYVCKISQGGDIIWENTYPYSSTCWGAYGIVPTSSGYVFASPGGRIAGISSSGSFEWQYETAVPEIMYADVCVAVNGDVVACGCDDESGVLTRLDPSGGLIWEKEYENCRLMHLCSAADSGFASIGQYSVVQPPYYFVLLKVDSEGNYEPLGIEPELEMNNAQLFSVHPNPITESATIRYALTESGAVLISVFEVSGRLVSSPVDCISAAGTYSFEMSDLPSGVYIVRMKAGEHEAVQRFVVINR